MSSYHFPKDAAIQIAMAQVKRQRNSEKVTISEVKENAGGWIVKGTSPIEGKGEAWVEEFKVVVDIKGKVKSADYSIRWLNPDTGSWFLQTSQPSPNIERGETAQATTETEYSKGQPAQKGKSETEQGPTDTKGKKSQGPVTDLSSVESTARTIQALKESKKKLELELEKLVTAEKEESEPMIEQTQSLEKNPQSLTAMVSSIERSVRRVQALKTAKSQLALELEELRKAADAQANSLEEEIRSIKEEIEKIKLLLS
jgi:DNA repair exonuclease SbcCD ATPase subunit